MLASRQAVQLRPLDQSAIDYLLAAGVEPEAMNRPTPIMLAKGVLAADRRIDPDPCGNRFLAFSEADETVFWQPERQEFGCDQGSAFALGESLIDAASTCAFDGHLKIFASPLSWLREHRTGIVVLPHRWDAAFDRLRDVPRIAVEPGVVEDYRRNMKPRRLPELFVLMDRAVPS